MKYLVSFFFLISGVQAAVETGVIQTINSIEHGKEEVTITFKEDNRVYRLPTNHSEIPCLENAQMAQKQVVLTLDQQAGKIRECKLFAGYHPGLRMENPTPAARTKTKRQ